MHADTIRKAVSTGDITPAIPKLLTDLLLNKPTSPEATEPATIPKKSTKTAPGRKPRATAAATKTRVKQTNTTTQGSVGDVPEQLSPKEKAILATEVVNGTLKLLSDAIKAPPQLRRAPSSSKDLIKTSTRNALRRSNSAPGSPLQPRSLNRVTSSPNMAARRRRSSSTASTTSGHRATAECSRIAFAYLRSLQGSKTPCIELPPLQIENGMSALIGKLVTLGLEDLAVKEMRILKRRLEVKEKVAVKPAQKKAGKTVASDAQPQPVQSLAQLLDFGDTPPSGPTRNLVITMQLQILKLLATSKKVEMVEAIVPTLQKSNPTSPTNILLEAAKEAGQQTKVARQLENLSQLVLSLTPSVSSIEDVLAVQPELCVSPEKAIQLQQLALMNRLLWWKMSNHQSDIEKDILEPFSRCLAAFARRTQNTGSKKYQLALKAFNELMDAISNFGGTPAKGHNTALCSMYKVLGALAQEAQELHSAIQWTDKLNLDCQGTALSDAARCAITARLASLRLRVAPAEPGVEGLLLELLEHLEGPLKGDSADLDEMLAEVSATRRTVIGLISKRNPTAGKTVLSDGLRGMCEALIFQCPRLLLRYLGKAPENGTAKAILRYEQRRQTAARSGFHALDSALFLVRACLVDSRMTWDLMDSTLQDGLMLLNALDQNKQPSEEKPASASYFVRISHLYFTQHLNMKRDSQSPKDVQSMKALRRSIDAVRDRHPAEKLEALFISKLDRLADAYRDFGRLDDAIETLLLQRDELVMKGVMSNIVQSASSRPLKVAWSVNEEACILSRNLASLLKLHFKKRFSGSLINVICHEDWSEDSRAVVLEYLLETMYTESMNSKYTECIRNATSAISSQLLDLYQPDKFPVKRLRVQVRLLGACGTPKLSEDIQTNIASEFADAGLSKYLPHLQSLARSMMALQKEQPDLTKVKSSLAHWHSIVEKCGSSEALYDQIDDIDTWVEHLHSLSEYLAMKGVPTLRIAVCALLAKITELLESSLAPDLPATALANLGNQFLDLGYSGKAGLVLHKCQIYAARNGVTLEASLHSQLLYAQYLLDIGNVDKCENTLQAAHALLDQSKNEAGHSPATFSSRIHKDLLMAHGSFVYSRLAMERGSSEVALLHAKQSVTLVHRAWSMTDSQEKKLRSASPSSSETEVDRVGDELSRLNISVNAPEQQSASHEILNGPSFWILVEPLLRSLSHLSTVYEHNGMFRETLYYAEQAGKVAKAVRSDLYLATTLMMSARVWARSGNVEKASELLAEAREFMGSFCPGQETAKLHTLQGYLHRHDGKHSDEQNAYVEAVSVLNKITASSYISGLDRVVDAATVELEEKMSKMTLAKPKPVRKPSVKRKAAPSKLETVKKVVSRSKSPVPDASTVSDECPQIMALKGTILRRGAEAMLFRKKWDESLNALKEAEAYSISQSDIADQHFGQARRLLRESIAKMSADPVFSVLQDSTVSYPSVAGNPKGERSAADRMSGSRLSPPSKASLAMRGKSPTRSTFFDTLRQAQDHLIEAYALAVQVSSTTAINLIATLMSGIAVLLSASGHAKGKAITHPGFASYGIEMSRIVALRRERHVIQAEHKLASGVAEEELWWSAKMSLDPKRSSTAFSTDLSHFQKDYVDIIPKEWTAVSLSLSEDRTQLCVTKLQADQSPFILRLPLGRNDTEGAAEEAFDFEQGRDELLEIIQQANFSAHDTRNRNTKAAKLEWWAEREALDLRMKDLLQNIENIWLGGFRGIFSQHQRRTELLARFSRSFHNILDKYLPSRQKKGRGKAKASKIVLDARVLELFIGLGDASAEDAELDEPLTDLLYFVVDILQFHGERNAYDEVDFDSIVVETLTALSCYHEQAKIWTAKDEHRHTILIVDKALHRFPWESLPCMDGLAVSRLPSLGCLRERILAQQEQIPSEESPAGHYITRTSGSYILNPSSDLPNTQKTFLPHLTSLPSPWDGTVNTPPTEAAFTSNLQNNDLFLYFGHGSGAQYIRTKIIRRLSKCAVSFLMGCSSGEMKEAGEFEAYGVPVNYLLGGCPGLVGTLWDVTDRDIDRFAERCLVEWGLFEEKGKGKGAGKKGKGKDKGEERKEKVSLVEAVAEGKKACTLRYLTAAAVCVWGVPVYFK